MSARTACLLVTIMALAAGCGDSSPQGDAPAASGESPGSQAGPAPTTDAASVSASVALEPRSGGTSIQVTVSGLDPETRYPVQVHEGTCEDRGLVALPLGRVTARPDGTGSVRMTVAEDRLPSRFSVHVQDPNGSPVACADPPN